MDGEVAVQSELKNLIVLFRGSSQQLRQRSAGEIYSNCKIIYWLPAPLEDLISLLFSSPSAFLFIFNLYTIIKRFGYIYHHLTSEAVYLISEFLCNSSQVDDCII